MCKNIGWSVSLPYNKFVKYVEIITPDVKGFNFTEVETMLKSYLKYYLPNEDNIFIILDYSEVAQ